MPRVTRLGHTGIYVEDLARMRDFYTRILGLTVTDEDDERGMVFLSSRPEEEHHEFVIVRGRTAPPDARVIQQISWHIGSVDDLLAFHRLLLAEGVTVEREVTHGIALAIYFFDPEGNRIEVYWPTDQRVPQPFGKAIDLEQPAEAVLAQAQSLLPGASGASA
ncbi:MAG: VOC family protein [Chloroflexota bacterium]|nr:VOC family protein [Chloroflexota bacterium]